ncbi:MAG: hypothetical protein ACI38Q_07455 [Candidatus Bruticola sp.]
MSQLTSLLQSFQRLDGVLGACILSKDCEILAENLNDSVKNDVAAVSFKEFLPKVEALVSGLGVAGVDRHHLILDDKQLMIEVLVGGAMLVVFTSSDNSNQGRVRLEIRKSKKNIEAALA